VLIPLFSLLFVLHVKYLPVIAHNMSHYSTEREAGVVFIISGEKMPLGG